MIIERKSKLCQNDSEQTQPNFFFFSPLNTKLNFKYIYQKAFHFRNPYFLENDFTHHAKDKYLHLLSTEFNHLSTTTIEIKLL